MGLWFLTRPLGFVFRPIGLLMRGDFRGLFALLLGFALLGGLWETALFSLSTPATATAVMTETGVAVINPALGTMGVGPALLATIQTDAAQHPNDPVQIPGLKTQAIALTKGNLVGLTFDQATRKIYGNVAKAYYTSGPDAVFAVSVPTVSLVPDAHLDWLTALGLSTATLTAHGHAQTQQLALYLWGAAGILALIVLGFSKGWSRLYALSQAIFTGAVPGLALIGVVAFLRGRAPGLFAPFASLLHVVGDAVVPIYAGAGLAAVAVLVIGTIGSAATKTAAVAVKGAKGVRRTPVPVGANRGSASAQAASSYRPYNPSPASGSVYSNMGGRMGSGSTANPNAGATPLSGGSPASGSPYGTPSYGTPAYGQGGGYSGYGAGGQGIGAGYAQGQSASQGQSQDRGWGGYGQGYNRSESPSPVEAGWPPVPGEERMLQPTGTDGPATDAWLTDQGQVPPQRQAGERRAYPDYRSYQSER